MTSMLKFFAGILLVQAITAAQVILALRSEQPQIWLMLALFAVSTGFLGALWFSSIASHAVRNAMSKADARLLRERERVRTRAEQEKAQVIAQSHQQMARARSRAEARAHLKIGVAVAATLGLGGLVLLTQFMTLGFLALSSVAGAVGGYLFRARQEQRRERQVSIQALENEETDKLTEFGIRQDPHLLVDKGTDTG